MKKWDVFLSHASEDKETVALPLTESLVRSGLRVWLDRFELTVGDSLREKIDEGLAESRFGIVVLSDGFLKKGWPRQELNGLFAREEEGVKVLLPVWHGVDKATVTRWSPMLADRIAANTKDGIPAVSRAVAEAVLAAGRSRSLAGQFITILEQGPNPADVSTFLANYRRVLPRAVGHFGSYPEQTRYEIQPAREGASPDLEVRYLIFPTSCTWGHLYFFFCPASGSFFQDEVASGALVNAIERQERLLRWVHDHPTETELFWRERHRHRAILVAGRREQYSDRDRNGIRALHGRGIELRSYDWLIEACAAVERP